MIPQNKITDEFADKPKIYEKIKHDPDALICQHCSYNGREDWLKNYIQTASDKATVKQKDLEGVAVVKKFSRMIVKRGKYNDVIGVATEWL